LRVDKNEGVTNYKIFGRRNDSQNSNVNINNRTTFDIDANLELLKSLQ